MNKEEQARRAGMLYAYNIVQKEGIEGLEKEIKFRNITKAPLGIPKSKFEEFENRVRESTLTTVILLAAVTLHDEFDFGQKRIERFLKRFWNKAECIDGDYTNWEEQSAIMAEECGIQLNVTLNEEDV